MSDSDRVARRERAFFNAYAEMLESERLATQGLTEEQKAEREQILRAKAEQRRRVLWIHWLKVESWTVPQAACLIFGRNPDKPLEGFELYSDFEYKFLRTAEERLRAMADTRLKTKSRAPRNDPRYSPLGLIQLAAGFQWGLTADLLALAAQVLPRVEAESRQAFEKTRTGSRRQKKKTVHAQRSELVVQCARDILGSNAPKDSVDLRLTMNTDEFVRELKNRFGSTHYAILCRSPKTLDRARLDREKLPHLPKVHLKAGHPPTRAAEERPTRRRP